MQIFKIVFNSKVAVLLMLVLAVSLAVATFLENDHGTAYARQAVYEAWWFEVILLWLTAVFIYHIPKYKLLSTKKWPIGLMHIAFIVILIGSAVTRYFANEGIMPIREGQVAGHYYSNEKYLQLKNEENFAAAPVQVIAKGFEPVTKSVQLQDETFDLTIDSYMKGAIEQWDDGEGTFLDIAVAQEAGRRDYLVQTGERLSLKEMPLVFGRIDTTAFVNIAFLDSVWKIRTKSTSHLMEMNTQEMGVLEPDSWVELRQRTLYQWQEGTIMVKAIRENKERKFVPTDDEELAKELPDLVRIHVADENGKTLASKEVMVTTRQAEWIDFEHNGNLYSFTYGPKVVTLPFGVRLNKFDLERYPGSQSPSGYASEVTVLKEDNAVLDYRIFMNNVLDYDGYRFYQASYDEDEMGTVLAVNQDRPGTLITYLGYFLLTVSMIITLFWYYSRFRLVDRKIGKIQSETKKISTIFLLLMTVGLQANDSIQTQMDSLQIPVGKSDIRHFVVPEEYANQYGELIVQDLDGRMKPVSTLAYEIVRKLTGKTSITVPQETGEIVLSPEQFLLAVQMDATAFSDLALLQVAEKKCAPLFKILNKEPAPSLRFLDLVDKDGNYLLLDEVNRANRLKPAERNEYDKEILKLDERFNIFYAVMIGDFMRIFPNRLDDNNTWFTSTQWQQGFDEEDATFVRNIHQMYLSGLRNGVLTGDFDQAMESYEYIDLYQRKAGEEVYPSENEKKAELFYTKVRLGNYLFVFFFILGTFMLILAILQIFKSSRNQSLLWKAGIALSAVGLLFFTFDLLLRWYIAKHPPWSDGFEMMLFVAWGVLVFGLAFMKKSKFTLPLGLLGSGVLLFVSFLDWLNPEITNLMPVLNSYWLKIHVSIIVASYAPLALAAIIGLLCLFMLIFKPKTTHKKWFYSMQELAGVSEMAITIGLFLLTIGTFLGGVWANESWGRYWAWDPKETWALISILVYAIVLHLRLIPALKNPLVFYLASLGAFSSIIMTSYGVNYYLSGLHSYAKGDPVPIPMWVYYAFFLLIVVSVVAWLRYRNMDRTAKQLLR